MTTVAVHIAQSQVVAPNTMKHTNDLNQPALDPSLKHNVKKKYDVVKTKVFDLKSIKEPTQKSHESKPDLPPFANFAGKTYNNKAAPSDDCLIAHD